MPEPENTPVTPEPQKNNYQERIDQLIKKSSDAEQASSALAAQNETLTQQVLQLSEKIDKLTAPVSAAPAPNQELFGRAINPSNTKQQVPAFDENALRQIVQEAIAPLQQSAEKQRMDAELANQQKAAFNQAVATFPELGKQDSEAFQVFSQIWDNREDLQRIPDAPLFVAEAVRGITLSARTEEANTDSAKQIANVTRPGVNRLPLGNDASNARELKDKLIEKGEQVGFNDTDMDDYLKLKFMEQSGK